MSKSIILFDTSAYHMLLRDIIWENILTLENESIAYFLLGKIRNLPKNSYDFTLSKKSKAILHKPFNLDDLQKTFEVGFHAIICYYNKKPILKTAQLILQKDNLEDTIKLQEQIVVLRNPHLNFALRSQEYMNMSEIKRMREYNIIRKQVHEMARAKL